MPALDSSFLLRALLLCGVTGYTCRTALAWISRPSPGTMAYQSRLTTAYTASVIAVAFALTAWLGAYPAIALIPAGCYFLIRIFRAWQDRSSGVVTRLQLFLVSRSGELLCLAVLWFEQGKPLS